MNKILKEILPFNLADIFDFISTQTQEVIWICTNDYQEQLYLSPTFKNVWGLARETIYEHREIFPTTIFQEDIHVLMPDFVARQQGLCERTLAYRIYSSDEKVHFIKDNCFGICDKEGKQIALLGLAKTVSLQEWEEIKVKPSLQSLHNPFLHKDLAGLVTGLKLTCQVSHERAKSAAHDFYIVTKDQQIKLTKREAQCLVHLLKGQAFKVIAKELKISPRTVETHLIKIKEKMHCGKVLELVSKIENRKQISEWIFTDNIQGE